MGHPTERTLGHLREAFCTWINEGCPGNAVLEMNYEETVWPAERFLKKMQRCSDVMPGALREQLEQEHDLADAWTYGAAARELLKQQAWVDRA